MTKGRPHGRTKYVLEKCRCPVCRADAAAYERARRRHLALAHWGAVEPLLVDATPAREHIAMLSAYGIGAKRLSELSGVARAIIARLNGWSNGVADNRPAAKVRPDTLRRILAVQPTPRNARPNALIDALGSGRKLRGLAALGWTTSELGRRLGVDPSNMGALMGLQPGDRITAARFIQIDDLYEQLCMTHGGSDRAAQAAAAKGWAPPLAWDDIDDPAETRRRRPGRNAS